MIRHSLGIAAFLSVSTIFAHSSPKIALVRVKEIYTEQPATKAAQNKARKDKEAILLDPRAEELREAIEALRQLQKNISDTNKQQSAEAGRKLAREFEIKRLETSSLQEEFEKFRASREKEINKQMVAEMRAVLNRIVTEAQRAGREKGYELVIDSSGATNSSAPFVLYARNAPDLTEEVTARLKKQDEAQTPGQNPAPAPADAPSGP